MPTMQNLRRSIENWVQIKTGSTSLEEHQKENSITLEVHDRKILESEQRISHSEQGNNVTMKALLALLSHGIDGNAIEPMKEAKAALENYLIDGQNNTKNITN